MSGIFFGTIFCGLRGGCKKRKRRGKQAEESAQAIKNPSPEDRARSQPKFLPRRSGEVRWGLIGEKGEVGVEPVALTNSI